MLQNEKTNRYLLLNLCRASWKEKTMKLIKIMLCAFICLVGFTKFSSSGPFTDDLSRCVVVKTTNNDKIALINWMWIAMSAHPDIAKNMGSKISKRLKEVADKKVAYIVSNLFLDKCRSETDKAFKFEGDEAVVNAFKPLGEISMKNLMQNRKVINSLSSYSRYLNPNLLELIKKYRLK